MTAFRKGILRDEGTFPGGLLVHASFSDSFLGFRKIIARIQVFEELDRLATAEIMKLFQYKGTGKRLGNSYRLPT